MEKIVSISGAAKFAQNQRSKGFKVGLVVGSFDIVHMGHVNLFRFAKKHVNYLILGLDNDKTIRWVKGDARPINNEKRRSELLSDFETVDKIFIIKSTNHHDSENATQAYGKLVSQIKPTHIFTHKICDAHWQKKMKIAMKNNIIFLVDRSRKVGHAGEIIKKLYRS